MIKINTFDINMYRYINSCLLSGNLCPEKLLALKHWTGVKFPRNNITPSGLADMFQMGELSLRPVKQQSYRIPFC